MKMKIKKQMKYHKCHISPPTGWGNQGSTTNASVLRIEGRISAVISDNEMVTLPTNWVTTPSCKTSIPIYKQHLTKVQYFTHTKKIKNNNIIFKDVKVVHVIVISTKQQELLSPKMGPFSKKKVILGVLLAKDNNNF